METRSITCIVDTTEEQAAALKAVVLAFNAACDYISGVAWEQRIFRAYDLHHLTYYAVRERFKLPAQLTAQAIGKVADAYKASKAVRAKFRPLGAVTYDSRVLRLLNLSVVSLTTLSGRMKVKLKIGGYQRTRLAGATLGETKLVFTPEMNRWSFVFTVKMETPPVTEGGGFLGVDMGVVNVAADSDGNLYTGGLVRGLRLRHRRLRSKLQAKSTKGTKRLLRKRRTKEARFQANINHTLSKRLVTLAKDTGRGIAVEDLNGIRSRITAKKSQRAGLSAWAFGQLRFFLAYKCVDAGIPLVAVDPRGTSRTCPSCGHCAKANRKTQAVFSCVSCGSTGHADLFAALNIERRAVVNRPNCAVVRPVERTLLSISAKPPGF